MLLSFFLFLLWCFYMLCGNQRVTLEPNGGESRVTWKRNLWQCRALFRTSQAHPSWIVLTLTYLHYFTAGPGIHTVFPLLAHPGVSFFVYFFIHLFYQFCSACLDVWQPLTITTTIVLECNMHIYHTILLMICISLRENTGDAVQHPTVSQLYLYLVLWWWRTSGHSSVHDWNEHESVGKNIVSKGETWTITWQNVTQSQLRAPKGVRSCFSILTSRKQLCLRSYSRLSNIQRVGSSNPSPSKSVVRY